MLNSVQASKKQAYGLGTHTLAAMTSWTHTAAGLSSSDHGSHITHHVSSEHGGGIDAVEAYFECITSCSLDDEECITVCTTVLRDHN